MALTVQPPSEPTAGANGGAAVPQLRRVLSLRDLIFYGIVAITPCAPVTVFGTGLVDIPRTCLAGHSAGYGGNPVYRRQLWPHGGDLS